MLSLTIYATCALVPNIGDKSMNIVVSYQLSDSRKIQIMIVKCTPNVMIVIPSFL